MLRDRLKPVCRRTLRKDVQEAGHINYTRRIPATFKFEPETKEIQLYESLSEFLRRKDTIAFGAKPNQLVTLVVRKILGSSTFAVADTLVSIIHRLKALTPVQIDDVSDIDTAEELAEEWTEFDEEADPEATGRQGVDKEKLAAEIAELEGYLTLARSIPANAKGAELVRVLPDVLDRIEKELGGKRKAVIFTESVRTQRYLFELLSQNGYGAKSPS